jgi:AAA domain
MQLRKATRKKAKIRLGFSAVSGGGKTVSALLVAYGMTGDWSKIALIDSESESADLYANHELPNGVTIGEFNVLPISAPFTPEKYIEAIKVVQADQTIEVLIIDSITHEWDGKGGCLEILDQLTEKDPKHNSYTQWAKVTPRHQAFIDAILQSTLHVFTTVRRKQDYDMSTQNGKTVVTKAGLKEITRDGFEYELTANLELDQLHNATASKDRTGLFMDKPSFTPSIETGQLLKEWCESGIDPIKDAIGNLLNCNAVEDLKMLKDGLSEQVVKDPAFVKAATDRYNTITSPIKNNAA